MVTCLTKNCTNPTVQPYNSNNQLIEYNNGNSFELSQDVTALDVRMETTTTCDDGKVCVYGCVL